MWLMHWYFSEKWRHVQYGHLFVCFDLGVAGTLLRDGVGLLYIQSREGLRESQINAEFLLDPRM